MPSVSVIIPSYNAERWIKSTIDSVLAQTYSDIEIIVVDDGSTDQTVSVVSKNYPKIKLITQTNQGVAAARNKGIENSRGEWVAFLDADDIWLPHKLHEQFILLEENPDVKMVYAGWHVWPCSDLEPDIDLLVKLNNTKCEATPNTPSSGWIYPELLEDCLVWTSTVLIKKSLLKTIGNFNQKLKIGEDYDLWLRASRETKIIKVNKPLALYRIHGSSLTKSTPSRNYQGEIIENAVKLWGYYSPDGRLASKHRIRRSLAKTWLNFSDSKIRAKEYFEAWIAAKKALQLDPLNIYVLKNLANCFLKNLKT